LVWLQFIGLSLVIVIGGTKAARYADIIAEKSGLGRIRIGLVLLALVSSMPELSTGISAVSLVKMPDLALGTLLGSCLFNLLIIVLLDVLYRREPILSVASRSHMASAGLGILLIALTGGVILAGDGLSGWAVGWIGIPSAVIILLYGAGMWGIFRHEHRRQQAPQAEAEAAPAQPLYAGESVRLAWGKFSLAAAAVIGAGIWLAFIGEDITASTGWGASFVGSLLLAISTSLPETVIGIAALRLGAVDMAVANVLGANMINVAKIFIIDIFYTEGAVLSSVSQSHAMTAGVAVAMTFVVLIALRFRPRRKTFGFISWYAVVLLGLYIYGAYALFDSSLGGG
jgi:cation:H+ antiporter